MAIDSIGLTGQLNPINRQETRTPDAPTVARQEPSNAERQAPPDVQVDTALGRREAASRALVQESSDLGVSQQEREALLDRLRTTRDALASGESGTSLDDRQIASPEFRQLAEDSLEELQRIRENALADPFGQGIEDAGGLEVDGFFVRDLGQTLDNMNSVISALERQSALEGSRIDDLQATFDADQAGQLSPGNAPIGDSEEAAQVAAQLSEQIREETPLDINGLSTDQRSTVLNALQT